MTVTIIYRLCYVAVNFALCLEYMELPDLVNFECIFGCCFSSSS